MALRLGEPWEARAASRGAGCESRLADVERGVTVLIWMTRVSLVLTVLLVGSTFGLWSKLGEIGGQLAQIARVLPR